MSHEDLSRMNDAQGSSDRFFGFTFSAVFLLVAIWPLFSGNAMRVGPLLASGILAAMAVLRPSLFAWPNRLWSRFGALLHKITNPIILGIIFFLVLTPTGLLMRLFRKYPSALHFEPAARSYWIIRTPAGPDATSLTKQF